MKCLLAGHLKISTKRLLITERILLFFRLINHIMVRWLFEIKIHVVVIYVLGFDEHTKQKPVRPYDLF